MKKLLMIIIALTVLGAHNQLWAARKKYGGVVYASEGKKDSMGRKLATFIENDDANKIDEFVKKKEDKKKDKKKQNAADRVKELEGKDEWDKKRNGFDSPVTYAAVLGSNNALKKMIELGFTIKPDALLVAAAPRYPNANAETANILLSPGTTTAKTDAVGVDVNYKDDAHNGFSALYYAVRSASDTQSIDLADAILWSDSYETTVREGLKLTPSDISGYTSSNGDYTPGILSSALYARNFPLQFIKALTDLGAPVTVPVLTIVLTPPGTDTWNSINYELLRQLIVAGIHFHPGITLPVGSLANPRFINALFNKPSGTEPATLAPVDPSQLVEGNGHDVLWHAIHDNDLWLVGYLTGYDVNKLDTTGRPFSTVNFEGKDTSLVASTPPNFMPLTKPMDVAKKYSGTDRNKTPVMIASYYHETQPNDGKWALQGAGWNQKDGTDTAKNEKIIRALLDKFAQKTGVDLNMKDDDGITALMWAARAGHGGYANQEQLTYDQAWWSGSTLAEKPVGRGDYWVTLIDKGADLKATDAQNRTALMHAQQRQQPRAIDQIQYALAQSQSTPRSKDLSPR